MTARTGAAGITAAAGVTEGACHTTRASAGARRRGSGFAAALLSRSRRTARGAAAAATRGHARGRLAARRLAAGALTPDSTPLCVLCALLSPSPDCVLDQPSVFVVWLPWGCFASRAVCVYGSLDGGVHGRQPRARPRRLCGRRTALRPVFVCTLLLLIFTSPPGAWSHYAPRRLLRSLLHIARQVEQRFACNSFSDSSDGLKLLAGAATDSCFCILAPRSAWDVCVSPQQSSGLTAVRPC